MPLEVHSQLNSLISLELEGMGEISQLRFDLALLSSRLRPVSPGAHTGSIPFTNTNDP
jgi:hypothetical protein